MYKRNYPTAFPLPVWHRLGHLLLLFVLLLSACLPAYSSRGGGRPAPALASGAVAPGVGNNAATVADSATNAVVEVPMDDPVTAATLQPFLRDLAATDPDERVNVVIQQRTLVSDLATLVTRLGGQVTHQLPLINAFAATLPAHATVELAHSPSVKWISLDAPLYRVSGAAGPNLRDEFNATSYNGSEGSLPWETAWTEIGETDGPLTGDVAIVSFLGGHCKGCACKAPTKDCCALRPCPPLVTHS